MVNTFEVFGSSVETFPSKKGGEQKTLRVVLLDASNPPMAQFFELNLSADEKPPAKGVRLTLQITEISSVFSGRPRLRATIIPTPPVK